jgi:hypothetical protein
MSLPSITPEPDVQAFMAPWDREYRPLEELVAGGTAIGDGEAGRFVQLWVVFYEDGVIKVAPETGTVAFTLAVPGVTQVSLGFDANMSVNIAYQTESGSHLYYFDTLTSSFQTLTVPGADSCRCCADELRVFNVTASDVIFAYTLDGTLFFRRQRDRYLIEYTVGPSDTRRLLRAAPNVHLRFQFKLGNYTPPAEA